PAIALVLAYRNDVRILGVVGPAGNAALQCLLVGALEMAQRLGPGGVHAGVLHPRSGEVLLAPVLDARERQLLAEDVGQLVEREIDLERVLPFALAGLAAAVALDRSRRQHRPGRAVALPYPALILVAVLEVGNVDGRNGNGDQVLPLLPDHLPFLDVLAQV